MRKRRCDEMPVTRLRQTKVCYCNIASIQHSNRMRFTHLIGRWFFREDSFGKNSPTISMRSGISAAPEIKMNNRIRNSNRQHKATRIQSAGNQGPSGGARRLSFAPVAFAERGRYRDWQVPDSQNRFRFQESRRGIGAAHQIQTHA